MTDDSTFGGYVEVHERPPAFQGTDGAAYSAAIYVDDEPDPQGRYGAAILFVRWSDEGDRPVGHVETPYLGFGATQEEAAALVRALTLLEVKRQLDRAIRLRRTEDAAW
jgi:hypothetical protein